MNEKLQLLAKKYSQFKRYGDGLPQEIEELRYEVKRTSVALGGFSQAFIELGAVSFLVSFETLLNAAAQRPTKLGAKARGLAHRIAHPQEK